MTIATPANQRLDTDFDGMAAGDDNVLEAARADLADAAATERRFDAQLLGLPLRDSVRATAGALVAANESRAALTSRAAAAPTLTVLHGYDADLAAANAAVEQQVRAIRSQLGLPPPDTT